MYKSRWLKITLLLIVAFIAMLGCNSEDIGGVSNGSAQNSPNDQQNNMNMPLTSNMNKDTLNYLALGDSYTIGASVLEEERWPVQMMKALKTQGYIINESRIIAATGWTTGDLLSAISHADFKKKYDLVSLLIGVNNQYQHLDISVFRSEFTKLLDRALKLATSKERVFVLSIPDYGVTPFGKQSNGSSISQAIDQYNTIAGQICNSRNIPFYDITEISRDANNDLSLVAGDGLHPSGKMYARWVSGILDDVIGLINQ